MADDVYNIGNDVPLSAGSSRTGGTRRRSKNVLPRPFYLSKKLPALVFGCVVLTACYQVNGQPEVQWHLEKYVVYTEAHAINSSDFAYRSLASKFKTEPDLRIRSEEAAIGEPMKYHFLEFAKDQWLVLEMSCSDSGRLHEHNFIAPFVWSTPAQLVKVLGPWPSLARSGALLTQ